MIHMAAKPNATAPPKYRKPFTGPPPIREAFTPRRCTSIFSYCLTNKRHAEGRRFRVIDVVPFVEADVPIVGLLRVEAT
jgi:hypothetical protein